MDNTTETKLADGNAIPLERLVRHTKVTNSNYEIKVGDIITADSSFGRNKYVVHRLSKKYSYVKFNDVAEGKFPRIYNRFGFARLPRDKWNTTVYTVYSLCA